MARRSEAQIRAQEAEHRARLAVERLCALRDAVTTALAVLRTEPSPFAANQRAIEMLDAALNPKEPHP